MCKRKITPKNIVLNIFKFLLGSVVSLTLIALTITLYMLIIYSIRIVSDYFMVNDVVIVFGLVLSFCLVIMFNQVGVLSYNYFRSRFG